MVVVAATGIEVVDPQQVRGGGRRGKIDKRVVGMMPTGGDQDGAGGVEHLQDRRHPRVDPSGPDLGPDPLPRLEADGVVVRLASRRAGCHCRIDCQILRLGGAVWLSLFCHFGCVADSEDSRVAHAIASDRDHVVEPRGNVGENRHQHPARDGTRLGIKLTGLGHCRRGRDARMGEGELFETVEIGAQQADRDLRTLPAPGRLKRGEGRPGEIGVGRWMEARRRECQDQKRQGDAMPWIEAGREAGHGGCVAGGRWGSSG